ncbi:MAG: hypothetical protein LBF84_00290, partial [Holosporales bacterium]|nr:hypothetical protein [Holosporales bacterium]
MNTLLFLGGVLIFSYIVALTLDIPQHIANDIVKKKIENLGGRAEIGEITGFFPFSFNIANIKIQVQNGVKARLDNIDFWFSWRTFRINLTVKGAVVEGLYDSASPLKTADMASRDAAKPPTQLPVLQDSMHIRPVAKVSNFEEFSGAHEAQNRSVLDVREDSSIGATPKLP